MHWVKSRIQEVRSGGQCGSPPRNRKERQERGGRAQGSLAEECTKGWDLRHRCPFVSGRDDQGDLSRSEMGLGNLTSEVLRLNV